MHEIDKTLAAVRRVADDGKRGILVTIVATRGSTYRRAGARAVISEDGDSFGTLSGGCLERDLAERARAWLGDPKPRLFTYDSTKSSDIVFGLGLGCRGEIDVLIEPFDRERLPRLAAEFRWNGREPVVWTTALEGRELLVESIRPERAIAIFGGGNDVEPVARIAEQIGWRAAVISPKDMHPETVKERVDLGAFDAAVIMTHTFLHDLALLAAILPSPIPYVGLLGPRTRGEELLAQLGPEIPRQRLHSPMGLDLGGETPEEIALAIVAEIQAVLNQRDAKSLRDLDRPIHATMLQCR
ncbi:MAG TPA: XdhC family protein [Thermoanaerobaculia bacterium]|nr:XdhC family protein [Thermoanaerobaculia bacterium]